MSGIQVASGTLDLSLAGETTGIIFSMTKDFTLQGNNAAVFSFI